jgi:molybdopterin-guanine dinucleotide biosynthesis protein A
MLRAMRAPCVGIFVGGSGSRMGGRDKSQLPAPGGRDTLLGRWLRVLQQAGLQDVVLVGGAGAGERPRLQDDPPGIGPLGGLSALLKHAGPRAAITLACDMPYVEAGLLRRLVSEAPDATALAPRDEVTGKWQPMFARYDAPAARPVVAAAISDGRHALQAVLGQLEAQVLSLDAAERAQLRDWDRPEDVER